MNVTAFIRDVVFAKVILLVSIMAILGAMTTSVNASPVVAVKFTPPSVPINTSSIFTIALTNPDSTIVSGVTFNHTYPLGMVNATPNSYANTCGGIVTLVDGGTSLSLSGGTIPANGNCIITVNVTSNRAGSYTNNLGSITCSSGSASPASATLTTTLLSPPNVSMTFSPKTVQVNMPSLQTITLTNPNPTDVTGVSFNHNYPSNMINATPTNLSNTCQGTLIVANGGSSMVLNGGTIPAKGSCTVMVNVTSTIAGSYPNNFSSVATSNSDSVSPVSETLTTVLLAPPNVSMTFSPPTVQVNMPSLLTIALINPNPTAVTGVMFNQTYQPGMVNAAPANAKNTCGTAAVANAVDGGTSLGISGGIIPPNGNCTVTVNVTSAKEGTHLASTGPISTLVAGTVPAATSILTISSDPTTKNHKRNLGEGDVRKLRVEIPRFQALQGGIECKAPAQSRFIITAVSTDDSIYFVRFNYVEKEDSKDNSPETLTTTAMGAPTVKKSFNPNIIGVNGTSVLTITLANPNSIPITGTEFTETYPPGLINSAAAGGSTTCQEGKVTAANDGNSVSLVKGIIPPNGSCIVTVNVTNTRVGSLTYNTETLLRTTNAGKTNDTIEDKTTPRNRICEENVQYRINAEILNSFDTTGSGVDTGLLLAPYKLHFDDHSFSGATTIGPYIGWRSDWPGFSGTTLLSAGLGVVPVSNGTTSTNTASFSFAIGQVLNIVKTNFQAGLLVGIDWTGNRQYKHEGELWIAMSFGTNFLQ